MRDITLGDTFYHFFTTRAFASGVPTQLAGTPVLSVLEENNATPITAGVSVSVDRATVTGLNQATIIATGANGYESGKSYAIYISTGTVGGVSVVGEVVGEFTIAASAAAVDLANGTDGLGAIKTDTAAILVDTGTTLDAALAVVDANVDAILADTGTDGVVVAAASKTGYALSAAGVTAVWAEVMDGTRTAVQAMRGFMAALLGKASGLPTAPKYRNIGDTTNVIDATTDSNGNRTAVTLDLT